MIENLVDRLECRRRLPRPLHLEILPARAQETGRWLYGQKLADAWNDLAAV
jgi:hypothetical protein